MTRGIQHRMKSQENKQGLEERGRFFFVFFGAATSWCGQVGGSFDIVRDTLGLVRTKFPHIVYFMAGT
ncbi:hypothetical protein S83_058061 [Arachis hypogaea]